MFSLVSDTAEGLDRTENEIEQYQDLNDPANCFESDNSDRSTEEGSSRISITRKRKKRTHETIRKKQYVGGVEYYSTKSRPVLHIFNRNAIWTTMYGMS